MKENITYLPELQHLIDILHRATDLNDENAQFYLACCFMKSEKKSTQKKVFAFFKELANQTPHTTLQTDAQYMLAQCYENGYGITKSYPQASKWYKKVLISANRDVHRAFEEEIHKEIEAALDEPDRNGIAPEALRCITEAAEGGDLESQKCLMRLYQFGQGDIEEDEEEYAYWAERAAENGDAEAMRKIGDMYLDGRGVKQDCKKALYWLEKAIARGEANAAYSIGCYYDSQKQYKTATKWSRICAELRIDWRNKKLSGKTSPLTASDLFK